jgi:uncharacterized protein (TIGR02466 family)
MQPIQAPNDIIVAFASPLLVRRIPDHEGINPGLAEVLKAERQKNPVLTTSAIGGWQSAQDLVVRGIPEMAVLMDHVGKALFELSSVDLGEMLDPETCGITAEAWGNIMSDGDFTMIHNHVRTDWSGVYYVDAEAGNEDVYRNGALELIDPRTVQVLTGPGKYRQPFRHVTIQPVNGLMVLFPSWMNHYVYPYFGKTERISIAFNAKVVFGEDRPDAEAEVSGGGGDQ